MTYTLRPTSSGDTLVSSRDPIRTNFQIITDRFDVNHVPFNSGPDAGKHKFLQMPEQTGAIPTAANEAALFARTSVVAPGETALFFKSESGTGQEYQLTNSKDANIATFGGAGPLHVGPNGWTFLPGGMIMMFGSFPPVTGFNNPVSFIGSGLFKFPNNVFQVQISSNFANNQVRNVSVSGFDMSVSSLGQAPNIAYWMAIGN